jgi:hypothetical protein
LFALAAEQYKYRPVFLATCIVPVVEVVFVGLVNLFLAVSFKDFTFLIGVLTTLALLRLVYGLFYVALADHCFRRLIENPPPPLATNMPAVVDHSGGARIIQPGVVPGSTLTRNACPSCQVQLEYMRQPDTPTQVHCYNCQALVEFD